MISTDLLAVLQDVTKRLDQAGIAYMLTGSMAMGYYSLPRMTRDIDLVVALSDQNCDQMAELFESDYYVSKEAVKRAVLRRSMFNFLNNQYCVKVDFVVLKNEAFRQEEFSHRRKLTLGEVEAWVVSREDLILSKLVWAKDSHSDYQLRDVQGLLKEPCDMEYLRDHAARLGVTGLLEEVFTHE